MQHKCFVYFCHGSTYWPLQWMWQAWQSRPKWSLLEECNNEPHKQFYSNNKLPQGGRTGNPFLGVEMRAWRIDVGLSICKKKSPKKHYTVSMTNSKREETDIIAVTPFRKYIFYWILWKNSKMVVQSNKAKRNFEFNKWTWTDAFCLLQGTL